MGKLVERERIYKQLHRDMENRRLRYWRANTGWGKTTAILQYFAYWKLPYISISVEDEAFFEKLKAAAENGDAHILIDDLHRLEPEKQQGLNEYLEKFSDNTKVYLLGRAWIPPYLKKYEISNELVYYHTEQLAMNENEAAQLMELHGITCRPQLLTQIVRQTEGWMIYLILMARQGKHIEALNNKLIELTRLDLFDYFDHNIWNTFEDDIKNFLLNMGHLEFFTEQEACIVCGKKEVSDVLNKIQMTSSYLIQDDDTHYHFRKPMGFYLERKQKQVYDEATLKQRYENTALYFSMENDMPNALKYYSLAGDRQRMTEILIENSNSLAGDAYYYELEKYYLDLNDESIGNSPEMMAAMAMLHSLSMRIEESNYYMERLIKYEKKLPLSDSKKKIARDKIGFLQLALPHMGSSTMIEKFQRMSRTKARLQEMSISGDMASVMSGGLDFCEWSKMDRKLYRTMKLPISIVFGKYGDGLAEIALGESLFEQNMDGNYTESLMLLNSGKAACEITGNLQFQFAANGLLARMFLADGRLPTAFNLIENYYKKVATTGKRQLPLNTEAFLIWLYMQNGENAMAETWLKECAPNEYEHFFILERYRYQTKIKVYVLKKMYLEALSLLERLEQYFTLYGRRYNLAETKLLCAIVLYRMEDPHWKKELKKGLEITYEYQFYRVVADLGIAILPLLMEYSREVSEPEETLPQDCKYYNYLKQLLQTVRRQAELYPLYLEAKEQHDFNLTDSEKRVMKLLAQGMTNREIAEKLCISVTTVKSHTGNIYAKLEVKNRTAAVQAAKEMELI